jgi:hypothetical protein
MTLRKKIIFLTVTWCLLILLIELLGQFLLYITGRSLHPSYHLHKERLENFEKVYSDGKGGYSLSPKAFSLEGGKEYHPKIGWVYKEGTPDWGFNGPEPQLGKTSEVSIFVIGDSMMEQRSIEPKFRTSELLEKKIGNSDSINVFNFSIAGHTLEQQCEMVQAYVLKYKPDFLLWVMFIHNDFEDRIPNSVRDMQKQRDIRSQSSLIDLAKRSFCLGYVYPRARVGLEKLAQRPILPRFDLFSVINSYDDYYELQFKYFQKNYKKYCGKAIEMIKDCESQGVEVYACLLPDIYGLTLRDIEGQPVDSYVWKEQSELVIDEFKKHGVPLADPRNVISTWDISSAIDETGHMNKLGAELFSDYLVDELAEPVMRLKKK